MTDAIPYHLPKEPGRWRAWMLALLVHGLLFAFLWVGVYWHNETPATIEAEVWSPQAQEAAPRPQPEPKPEVKEAKEEAKEEIKETPKPVIKKPDIALEQEKKRREKQREDEKKEAERKEAERKEAERKAAAKKAADEKRRKELVEAQRLDKLREAEMRRITGNVEGTGGAGIAAKTQGNRGDASYLQRVGAKIKSNTIFAVPENLQGNPAVEYAVELLPDGSIRRPVRKIKASGVPGFDEAVLNAIEKSQPYPPDQSGAMPSGFNVIHKPKDQ